MEYDVKTFKKIDDIDSEDWDSVSSTIFTKHACLKEIEKLTRIKITPRYIAVLKNEKIVATTALYIEEDAEYFTIEESIFGKYHKFLKPFSLGLNPCLIGHIPIGTIFKSIEVDTTINAQEKIYQLIINSMEKIAKEEGIYQYGFLCIMEDEQILRKVLQENKFVEKFSSFAVYMDIVWESFKDYLYSFKRKQRNTIKWEFARQKKKGIITSHSLTLGDNKEEMIKLFNENFYKYQKRESKTNSEFIHGIYNKLENNIGLVIDKKDDKIVSCDMYFKWEDTISLFKVGQNYKLSEGSASLFNVSIYEPLKIAIKEGYSRIYNGSGAYQYKLLRGAKLKPMYIYVKSSSRIKQAFLRLVFPLLSHIKLIKHQRLSFQKKSQKRHNLIPKRFSGVLVSFAAAIKKICK